MLLSHIPFCNTECRRALSSALLFTFLPQSPGHWSSLTPGRLVAVLSSCGDTWVQEQQGPQMQLPYGSSPTSLS